MEVKIVAAYSRRFEPQWLVDDLRENLSWVDGFVEYDDRYRDPSDTSWDEHARYVELHRLAGEQGATHVIVSAPDERWQKATEYKLRKAITKDPGKFFGVRVLELFSPTEYRTDGLWATFRQCRIYRWEEGQTFEDKPLHNSCVPFMESYARIKFLPIRVYHTKPIERENQQKRVEVFNKIDPGQSENQGVPYEWMTDETNLRLQKIAEKDMYYPVYNRKYIWQPGY